MPRYRAPPRTPVCAILSMLLTATCWLAHPVNAATLNVPDDYATIQDAIDAAEAGDTVLVEPGTYVENLTLESSVNVRGRETARTILQADRNSQPIVTIDDETNITFFNLTLSDSATGFDIDDSSLITIASVVMERLDDAVVVDDDSVVELRNNVFWNNDLAVDRDTELVIVTNNIFSENDITITSTGGNANDDDANVLFNCFYDNDDLDDDGLGSNIQLGDPLFVDTDNADFHLRQNSPCIDAGTGVDVIDNSVADLGAYGGTLADPFPFPVPQPALTDTSTDNPASTNIDVDWDANLAYLVTNTNNPGSYRVWYQRNAPGPPYDGTDAGGGTQPSPIDAGDDTSFTLADLSADIDPPAAPELFAASAGNETVALAWSDVDTATGYVVSYGVDSVDENTLDVGQVTEYTVAGLANGTRYVFAVSTLAQATYYVAVTVRDSTQNANESVFSPEASIGLGDTLMSGLSNELTAIPEEIVPYPDLPDDCFVATAAYGAEWAAEVAALRDFRDRFLRTHAPGRAFVRWYYRNGPVYAAHLQRHEQWKPAARAGLWPLVAAALFMLGSSTPVKLFTGGLLLLLISAILRRRWRMCSPHKV